MAVLSSSRKLKKELSLFSVYTLATGATLSSGFFLLPGLAAAIAGPAVVFSYLLAVVPLLPGILSKIELATAMPRAGGEYYFLDRSLGPLVGTIAGFGTWCGLVLKTAFALIGIGAYLRFFPALHELPMTALIACAAIAFGVLNLFGPRLSGVFQSVLVIGLLVLLAWFTAWGMPQVKADHFANLMGKGSYNLMAAAGLVCVSFMGLTNVASVAEEVKDPERNLTLGIFLALGTALLVYGLGTFVIVGLVPPDRLYGSLTPVADAAEEMVGHTGAVVMTVAALLAFFSVANATILGASRYPLAMSRDHLLPRWFRQLNRYKTPHNGIIVTVGLILIFVLVFDATKIAKLASAFVLLLFAMNCLAVIVMRESRIESYDPGFRCPWYPWTQVVGIFGPFVFIVVMGWLAILFSLGLIVAGACWYYYYARRRVVRGGAIYHLFARLGQRRYAGLDRELRGILKEKGLREQDPYDEVVARAGVLDITGPATFEQVVQQACEQLAVHLPQSAEQLAGSFMEGTLVGATPVSKHAALPHIRLLGLDRPLMIIARITSGVHIEVDVDLVEHSIDQAIYAVIFLISPEEDAAQHLRILAQVASHIDDENFMTDWQSAKDKQQLKESLLREDRFLSLHLQPQTPSAVLIGRALRDVSLPEDCLIALIHRGDQTVFPSGNTTLEEGDRLTIVGLPSSIDELKAKYQGI